MTLRSGAAFVAAPPARRPPEEVYRPSAQAQAYLGDIEYAQANGANGDGRGIIASSRALSDCDGSKYYPSPHVAATAWDVPAAAAAGPIVSLERSRRQ